MLPVAMSMVCRGHEMLSPASCERFTNLSKVSCIRQCCDDDIWHHALKIKLHYSHEFPDLACWPAQLRRTRKTIAPFLSSNVHCSTTGQWQTVNIFAPKKGTISSRWVPISLISRGPYVTAVITLLLVYINHITYPPSKTNISWLYPLKIDGWVRWNFFLKWSLLHGQFVHFRWWRSEFCTKFCRPKIH